MTINQYDVLEKENKAKSAGIEAAKKLTPRDKAPHENNSKLRQIWLDAYDNQMKVSDALSKGRVRGAIFSEIGSRDTSISNLTQAKKTSVRHFLHKRNIDVSCRGCGYETKFSESAIRQIKDGKWLCPGCKKKEHREFLDSVLALEKRKQNLKKRK